MKIEVYRDQVSKNIHIEEGIIGQQPTLFQNKGKKYFSIVSKERNVSHSKLFDQHTINQSLKCIQRKTIKYIFPNGYK